LSATWAWLAAAGDGGNLPALDLAGLPAATLRVLNETLGEGEVSAIVEAGHEVRVQETVFSGVWREQHLQRHAPAARLSAGRTHSTRGAGRGASSAPAPCCASLAVAGRRHERARARE
jgi:hypothetical protein